MKKIQFTGGEPWRLLFPWIGVFSCSSELARRSEEDQSRKSLSKDRVPVGGHIMERGYLSTFLTTVTLWLLGPVTLVALWMRFLGQRDSVTIVPCVCLVFSVMIARSGARRRISFVEKWVTSLIGLVIVIFTALSISELTQMFGLEKLWIFAGAFLTPFGVEAFEAGFAIPILWSILAILAVGIIWVYLRATSTWLRDKGYMWLKSGGWLKSRVGRLLIFVGGIGMARGKPTRRE